METIKKTEEVNLKEVMGALGALAVLEGKVAKRPVDEAFVQKLKQWSSGLFRIVVMGEIKKGKSSFINALLGFRDLVPVSSNVATSTIFKICYGEKIAYKVFFTKESQKPCVVIDKSQLAQYGTEDGNPANEKQVDFIQVFAPSAFLRGGLVIIDTPGLGGLFKQHKRITYEYVPKADAVFMVSDSVESPIGKNELDLLDELKKVTDQIFFVQTKAMAVDTEAREARERNNRRTLENHGFNGQSLKYFVVDSHLKLDADEAKDKEDLIDSGFVKLAMFVNNEIQGNVRRNIVRTAIRVATPKFQILEQTLADDEKLLAADSEGARRQIAEDLKTAEEDVANWQHTELPRLQDRLQDGLREIRTSVGDQLGQFRPQGKYYEVVAQTIESCATIDELFLRLNQFSDNVANLFTEAQYNILKDVRQRVERLLKSLCDDRFEIQAATGCVTENKEAVDVNATAITRMIENEDPRKKNLFEKGHAPVMAGAGMGFLINRVLDCVVPGLGVAGDFLCAALGVAGGLATRETVKAGELKKAKQQAMAAVTQTMAPAYQNLNEGIQRVLTEVESSVVRSLREAVTHRQEDLANRRKELQQRQTETVAQLNEKRKQLTVAKQEFNAIKAVVARAV